MQLELYHEHARGGFGVQQIASRILSYRETAESGAIEWSDEGRDRAEIRAKMDAIIKESIEFVEKTGGPEAVHELMNREKQKQYDAATVKKTKTDKSGSFEFKMQRNETGTFWCYAVDPGNGDYWQVDVQRDPNYPGGYKKIVLTKKN